MPEFLVSDSSKPRIRLRKVDERWCATIEYARPNNPYDQAVRLALADVPPIVARQYGAYPNPHLVASIKACEKIAGIVVSESVRMQRSATLRAICIRDIALHLATCLQVGAMEGVRASLASTAIAIARTAREFEEELAGTVSQPKLAVGSAVSPKHFELERIADQFREHLPVWRAAMREIVNAVSANQAHHRRIAAEATELRLLMRAVVSKTVVTEHQECHQAVPESARKEHAEVWVRAPRGLLKHSLWVDVDTLALTKGDVIVPTEQIMMHLERHCSHLVNLRLRRRDNLAKVEADLVMLARAYNPCGLDLSGDFIEIIWEK